MEILKISYTTRAGAIRVVFLQNCKKDIEIYFKFLANILYTYKSQ